MSERWNSRASGGRKSRGGEGKKSRVSEERESRSIVQRERRRCEGWESRTRKEGKVSESRALIVGDLRRRKVRQVNDEKLEELREGKAG